MIQVSTDYVFDGTASRPYRPDDRPRPLGTYGRTKLAGEREVIRLLGDEAVILRTSWLYSRWGRNFVLTMLRLFEERDEVAVVQDQVGAPTWSRSLAEAIWAAASRPEVRGIHHWTDEGVDELVRLRDGDPGGGAGAGIAAAASADPAAAHGPVSHRGATTSLQRPRRDDRPEAALRLPRRHWRVSLQHMLQDLARA